MGRRKPLLGDQRIRGARGREVVIASCCGSEPGFCSNVMAAVLTDGVSVGAVLELEPVLSTWLDVPGWLTERDGLVGLTKIPSDPQPLGGLSVG